jgi:pilus assembly protein FimV
MKRVSLGIVGAAALVALGACKNGGNNTADTTGMSNGAAAGSVGATTTPDSMGTGAVAPGAPVAPGVTPGTPGAAGTTGTAGTPMDTAATTTGKASKTSKKKKPY